MRPARVISLIVGCLLLLPGIAAIVGGSALGVGYAFARSDDGYFEVGLDRLQTPTSAIRSEEIDFLADPGSPQWLVNFIDADVRIEAVPVGDEPLFLGIGHRLDVEDYLADVAHDEVVDLSSDRAPVYERSAGAQQAQPPADETFWRATATDGEPLMWEAASGRWAIVVMNVDGTAGVTAEVTVGAKFGGYLPATFIALGTGILLTTLAVALIIVGTRGRGTTDGEPATTAPSAVAGIGEPAATREHPVSVTARLDPELSRWMWLVKWILATPHVIVLMLLWIGFAVATLIAGVTILFTGRYPQRIWEYNLGVLRWTWRVGYYAWSGGLGTDRYPPFSLGREPDYPAVVDIAYPEHLSRGLVLVKWWLLAIPHYIILAIVAGGALGWETDNGWRVGSTGLLGVLVVIAAVILLVTGRYPRSLFDLIVGFNRWIFRVVAYVALMTDRYPPFRLDQGGIEPGNALPPPTSGPVTVETVADRTTDIPPPQHQDDPLDQA